jgi:hypothetical protein
MEQERKQESAVAGAAVCAAVGGLEQLQDGDVVAASSVARM